jgi:hypothetical protein
MSSWWPFGNDDSEESVYTSTNQEEINRESQFPEIAARHEMLRHSLFGETPLLQIEGSQPLIMTHEMLKRSVENLGFSSRECEGPFVVLSNSGQRIRAEGWEQIGGYIMGEKYGIWIPPRKIKRLKMWIIGTIPLIIPPIILLIYLNVLKYRRDKSEIKTTVIYSGFREVRTTSKNLGEPMLESMLDTISKHNLKPLSSFLGGISRFEHNDGNPGPVKITISYSMHSKQESIRDIIESDFKRLNSSLQDSLVVAAKDYSAVPTEPVFITTETQIHNTDAEFNSTLRFPVNLIPARTIPATGPTKAQSVYTHPPSLSDEGVSDNQGYEWITKDGKEWYRPKGTSEEWTEFEG